MFCETLEKARFERLRAPSKQPSAIIYGVFGLLVHIVASVVSFLLLLTVLWDQSIVFQSKSNQLYVYIRIEFEIEAAVD